MTKDKLDFEAAKSWAEQSEPDTSYISGGMKNLSACYFEILKQNELMRAALEFYARKTENTIEELLALGFPACYEKRVDFNEIEARYEKRNDDGKRARETLESIGELK